MWVQRHVAAFAQLKLASHAANRRGRSPHFPDSFAFCWQRAIHRQRFSCWASCAIPGPFTQRDSFHLTEDKLAFYQHCVDHGLATPAVRAALCVTRREASAVPIVHDGSTLIRVLAPLAPRDLVLKPVDGPALIEGNVTWGPLPTRQDLRAVMAALWSPCGFVNEKRYMHFRKDRHGAA